jgi:hypothetical protein
MGSWVSSPPAAPAVVDHVSTESDLDTETDFHLSIHADPVKVSYANSIYIPGTTMGVRIVGGDLLCYLPGTQYSGGIARPSPIRINYPMNDKALAIAGFSDKEGKFTIMVITQRGNLITYPAARLLAADKLMESDVILSCRTFRLAIEGTIAEARLTLCPDAQTILIAIKTGGVISAYLIDVINGLQQPLHPIRQFSTSASCSTINDVILRTEPEYELEISGLASVQRDLMSSSRAGTPRGNR